MVDYYKKLEERMEKIAILGSASSILYWDTAVMMPPGASEIRGKQLAELGVICHEMFVDRETEVLLNYAKNRESDLNDWQKANLREISNSYIKETAIPSDLVSALAKATTICESKWRDARKDNDFKGLLPYLKEVFNLNRRVAELKSEKLGLSKYDSLIDGYDPGMTQAKIDPLFNRLKDVLPTLIQEVVEHQKSKPEIVRFYREFPKSRQKGLCEILMKLVGFNTEFGIFNESIHPFCGGHQNDVRITTRYNEYDPMSAIFGVLHETGHAVYEQNLPKGMQPVHGARGMSIHESQSLIIEMQASRTWGFINFLSPLLKEKFSDIMPEDSLETDNIYRMVTEVKPSFIRVEADEVTYPAHIIVRYDIEKAILSDTLQIEDLPHAFNEGIKNMLGLDVPSDTMGCLQDIHWPSGNIGYFPSYTIGAMTAAQLFHAAMNENNDIVSGLSLGDFSPLRTWLNEKIHSMGSLLLTDDLILNATGKTLDASIYEQHLRNRYLNR